MPDKVAVLASRLCFLDWTQPKRHELFAAQTITS